MRRNAGASGSSGGNSSSGGGGGGFDETTTITGVSGPLGKDRSNTTTTTILPQHHPSLTTLSKRSDHNKKSKNFDSNSSDATSTKNLIIVIGICIVIVLGITSLRNNSNTGPAVQKLQSVIEQEIQQLHEEFGHHHAVHPISDHEPIKTTKDGRVISNYQLRDLTNAFENEELSFQSKPVSRGVAGRPLSETPALQNAKRAHIECDINVDSLAYWNENPSDHISTYHVPKDTHDEEYYISFSPDSGGWNNVRMSMEIIFVLAAVTGRTLVLPPKVPLYLLHLDNDKRHRGFADFFPLETAAFRSQIKIISFADFLNRYERYDPQFTIKDPNVRSKVYAASEHCDKREKATENCRHVYEYLESVGTGINISSVDNCVIFDENYFQTGNNETMTPDAVEYVETNCGPKRHPYYWTNQYNVENKLIHFRAADHQYRLLEHFYGMIYFTNPEISNYYKRFVRDYLHYHDQIYCAAGKVIQAIQLEGMNRTRTNPTAQSYYRDDEGTGGFSAFHVRRGDLQYKKVKISASEWYENTKELLLPNELLYIATDERDKSFFNDLKEHYDIRFLDDYWDIGELDTLDPNYMGMIDTIIASRGRIFVGTFFSTFTGYINRLRGYHGISMKDSYYSWLPRKNHTHEWKLVDDAAYAYEWPDGWIGIDTNTYPERDVF